MDPCWSQSWYLSRTRLKSESTCVLRACVRDQEGLFHGQYYHYFCDPAPSPHLHNGVFSSMGPRIKTSNLRREQSINTNFKGIDKISQARIQPFQSTNKNTNNRTEPALIIRLLFRITCHPQCPEEDLVTPIRYGSSIGECRSCERDRIGQVTVRPLEITVRLEIRTSVGAIK